MVAGGLGLAPLRPSIYHLLANRGQFGKVVLLYGTRSPEEILYRRQLETWRRRLDVQIEVTVDHAGGDWRGHVGVVTRLIPKLSIDVHHATALVCGPEVMMRFAAAGLHDIGLAGVGDLGLARAQHEMRGRAVRPLPVRRDVRLQGRRGGPLRPCAPADGAEGDLMLNARSCDGARTPPPSWPRVGPATDGCCPRGPHAFAVAGRAKPSP